MDTTQNQSQDNYTISSILYITSKALERAGYYGLRSILVLYMVGESLQMENAQAYAIYGWLATLLAITPLFGGVLGDLVLGNKWTAVAGGVLQALGAFVLCVPSLTMLYVGIGLISLGAGLYMPNVLSNFGKIQLLRKPKIDSGYTLFYTAINLGAFVGVLLIGFLGGERFIFGFIGSGVLLLVATLALVFAPKEKEVVSTQEVTNSETTAKPVRYNIAYVIIAIVLSMLFWGLYDLSGGFKFSLISDFMYQMDSSLSFGFFTNLGQYAVIFIGVIAVIAWYITNINRFVKMSIGFVLSALSFAILILMLENSPIIFVSILIVSAILLGIGELLIAPTVNSIVTLNSNPKYLAIIFALVFLPYRFVYYVMSRITETAYEAPKLAIGVTAVLLLLLGIATFIIYVTTQGSTQKFEQE